MLITMLRPTFEAIILLIALVTSTAAATRATVAAVLTYYGGIGAFDDYL